MSETVIINFITSLPALIAAVAALYFGIRGKKDANEAKAGAVVSGENRGGQ